jgi:hypothetical protein
MKFMGKAFGWFKKHPLAIVLVLGAIVLLVLVFSGGSSAQVSGSSGPSDAANAHAAEVAASVAMAQGQNAAQVAIAQLQSNTEMYTTDRATQVALAQTQSAENLGLAGLAAQVQIADYARDVNKMQIASTVEQARIASATYEKLGEFSLQGQLAGYQSAENVSYITAQRDVELARVNVDLQKVEQKKDEVDRFYDYKMAGSGGGGLGGIIGGILSIF